MIDPDTLEVVGIHTAGPTEDYRTREGDTCRELVHMTENTHCAGFLTQAIAVNLEPGIVTFAANIKQTDRGGVGDVTGDGKEDFVAFDDTGTAHILASTGTEFATPTTKSPVCHSSERCLVGDVSGDGRADAIAISSGGFAYVYLSNGTTFGNPASWGQTCYSNEECFVADANGDGIEDIISFVRSDGAGTKLGEVYVSLSTGNGFLPRSKWSNFFCGAGDTWWGRRFQRGWQCGSDRVRSRRSSDQPRARVGFAVERFELPGPDSMAFGLLCELGKMHDRGFQW